MGSETSIKTLSRSYPSISGASGGVVISHGASMFPNTAPTYQTPPVTYAIGTSTWSNSMSTAGRYLAWRIFWGGGIVHRFKTVLIDYTSGGEA